MKVSFFLLKFPLSSETFVLNQITAFIDMGFDVEIVALQKGDTQNTHAAREKYGWRPERAGCRMNRRDAGETALSGNKNAARIAPGGNVEILNFTRYGDESRNLILSSICAQVSKPLRADVFIAHFGPAGVTAAKLRELGLFRAKLRRFSTASIFPVGTSSIITRRNTSNCSAVVT